ncbi:AcrR family transcriptional regulator [Diaminobutyricimonas aerilata]|uniref:AcrR family transcriptional regulator n=1 Tax=Diaminobutyricimonas aerilata TaxID=1162967 RepID=A0A2M9CIX0_9MICO|nr:TetR/AcrR family transcriptional regulator [Diaminobutyricimonas aerilata]PJJ71837.1 AcrR family transcriptional regulator [Diaminobutyricimonas aerilata]
MSGLGSMRTTYRHGDLRATLVAVGIELARQGGPDAVVLREATRQAGVAPNAAYRHFADRAALLAAVSDEAQAIVADRIEIAFDAIPDTGDATADARARLTAIGRAYIDFACTDPGLFRAAFTVPRDLATALEPPKAGARGRTPFELLGVSLDALVEAGALPAERRPGAEFLAWSAVHGLAMLHLEGPLAHLGSPMLEGVRDRVVEMAVRGI